MPTGDRWLLPAGIEEILPPEAARLEGMRRNLLDLFFTWGYDFVIPPFIEYLESLLTGIGSDLELQTFKLTDQLSGRLMGVRADMTPQVARIDAHHLKREAPVRLCYLGTVLHTRPNGLSGSRSPVQIGAELYGHPGIDSDVEVLGLMLETLAVCGIRPVHLDVGHVGIFRGLARQAALTPELEVGLFDALQRKARSEIESMLAEAHVPTALSTMILDLVDLHGDEGVLEEAQRRLEKADRAVIQAMRDLLDLRCTMQQRHPDVPLHFDLGELRGYRYHAGVVFAAFIPGHGQEIARGGRYGELGEAFGRGRCATGFSSDLKALVRLGASPQQITPKRGILAPYSREASLEDAVRRLRANGERVIMTLPGQTGGPDELRCDRILAHKEGQWMVESIES